MNKPHKHAELIKAWADGAEIEAFDTFTGKWYSVSPTWNTEVQYRVRPEPQWYDNITEQGVLCFVSDKESPPQPNKIALIFKKKDRGFCADICDWKYARPVTLEEIQHLIYKGGQ